MKSHTQLIAILATATLAACGGRTSSPGETGTVQTEAKSAISTPELGGGEATQTTVRVSVCAGQTGLPAGFSLQWMTAADLVANGPRWEDDAHATLCKASFSGNAHGSRYALAPYACAEVTVGDLRLDPGASSSCLEALTCGTEYVFRAFGHATSTLTRSDFTSNLFLSTSDCAWGGGGCTWTQGYWKNHGPTPSGNNDDLWPAAVQQDGLILGQVPYGPAQLLAMLELPVFGNGAIALAHQLIAAKLNVANGASPAMIVDAIGAADLLIADQVLPPIGNAFFATSATGDLVSELAAFNEGALWPGHCADAPGEIIIP